MIVYLAGCKGNWRKKFIEAFPKVEFIDPFEDNDQRSIVKFVAEDLSSVKSSNLVIVYIGYSVYTGACVEVGYAYGLGIPIVLIWGLKKGRMEPFLFGVARKIFADVDTAINRLKRSRLMNG